MLTVIYITDCHRDFGDTLGTPRRNNISKTVVSIRDGKAL